ncbi:hypothetical protein PGQ11_009634 [Apiospora arundinis]|uniref:Uncharacterized protein n=1 Tax=Apiospora arundinis TaxID=335852 RepID=A0ABR2IIK7_9PEZI
MSAPTRFHLNPSLQLYVISMKLYEHESKIIRITQDANARFALGLEVLPSVTERVSETNSRREQQEYMNCHIRLRFILHTQESLDFAFVADHTALNKATHHVEGLFKEDADGSAADDYARSCLRCIKDQKFLTNAGIGLVSYIKQHLRRLMRNMLLAHGALGEIPDSDVPKLDLPRWQAAEAHVDAAMEPLSEEIILECIRAAFPQLRQQADSFVESEE